MISIICFEDDLIIPKEEAEKLAIKYKNDPKIGIKDGKLALMQSYDYYKKNCLEKDGKYYKDQETLEKDDPVGSSFLYTEYTGSIDYVQVEKDNHLVDLLPFASECKHKFYIERSINSKEPSVNNIHTILNQIEEKTTTFKSVIELMTQKTFNQKTNVHVGGGLITTYNDLLLKEDVCTDDLQTELNNGWRIIAVCIQPDQSRPDYILGRYNPELAVADKPNADR